MIQSIRFFVKGEPKGQPRPRAFARRMGNKYVARVFDAGTAEAWKSLIAVEATKHKPQEPLAGPISVGLRFAFARPKAHYRAGDPGKGLRDGAPLLHTGKPDADNLAKAVLDALTQLGTFWRDDSQVACLFVVKEYDGQQGCDVNVLPLNRGDSYPGASFRHAELVGD